MGQFQAENENFLIQMCIHPQKQLGLSPKNIIHAQIFSVEFSNLDDRQVFPLNLCSYLFFFCKLNCEGITRVHQKVLL